ncbi:ImmA/IrrE family metallo-endopeptidase [Acidovorax sp. MR-S7]|uniref:ImmA/IrrE family metallo-endopeptidase n=1 Tax=Acidovorax sp. MR-S7 TaxID=1268622 RepID=UPI00035F8C8F|nr:ImmA/IrrE family metallo-endopeptidase [Acidovorax sp. MR-S7]GAD22285.1 predicted Zn peptidase [Acidovorax sp. MR-S7]
MTTVAASIPVLRWAAQRAHLHDADVAARFRKWPLWLTGEAQPTLKQLEDFARLTHTAFGYFFLPQPPALALPVPDFRTVRDEALAEPSSALLDTLYLCQQRQDWYRDYARVHGLPPLAFVGSANGRETPEAVAQRMRETLGLDAEARRQLPTWAEALRQLIAKAEDAGVLVMTSSVVGSNSHRKLDVGEFRGFALADDLAPLVFLNGADSKAAQMFTLAHELAHVWLGATGVSDTQAGQVPEQQTERWCNKVAAELLMPLQALCAVYRSDVPIPDEIQRLAREFKVSTLVALRRLFDAGFVDQATLWQHYREEQARLRELEQRSGGGGDFYRSLGARASKRFARAIVSSTLEGLTSFPEAFRMLGLRKTATFHEAARELGVVTP